MIFNLFFLVVACSLDYGVSPIVPHHSSTPSRDNSIPFLTENVSGHSLCALGLNL